MVSDLGVVICFSDWGHHCLRQWLVACWVQSHYLHQCRLNCHKISNIVWQSSRPASFSPAGLTLWPSWLERWLATLSGLSVQVRIPVGLPGRYIWGSSAGLGKAQRIDSSLRADWLSCFSLAWWEWRVARQGCLVPLRKGGMWQSSRPASFSPAGLTLWSSWLECWLETLSGLSVQVRIPVGLPGRYNSMHQITNFKWLSSRLAVAFGKSIEARC